MISALQGHPAVDAVLASAAELLGMEVVFLGGLTEDTFTFEKVHARVRWPGLDEGATAPRTDSLCHRLLEGAPASTSDAPADPVYGGAPKTAELGITSYVGVPVHGPAGDIVATLCGIDRSTVPVDEETLAVLRSLAEVVSAQLGPLLAEGGYEGLGGIVIRRKPGGGWSVAGDDPDAGTDLTSAMVLADLLAGDLAPGRRPAKGDVPDDELERLRRSVTQLEHALAARVVVEQAIGVLTERQRSSPRAAFDRLRKAARSRGRKVHELAREVVLSSSDSSVPLPPELAGRR